MVRLAAGLLSLGVLFPVGMIVWKFAVTREARAVRDARWEAYAAVGDPGQIDVGVRLAARWAKNTKILKSEFPMATVRAENSSHAELIEAIGNADQRAALYNSLYRLYSG